VSRPRAFKGFTGKCATLEVNRITFMILARTPKQLTEISNYILRESGQTLAPEMIVPGIVIEPSLLPEPKKPETKHEQQSSIS